MQVFTQTGECFSVTGTRSHRWLRRTWWKPGQTLMLQIQRKELGSNKFRDTVLSLECPARKSDRLPFHMQTSALGLGNFYPEASGWGQFFFQAGENWDKGLYKRQRHGKWRHFVNSVLTARMVRITSCGLNLEVKPITWYLSANLLSVMLKWNYWFANSYINNSYMLCLGWNLCFSSHVVL